MRLRTRVGLFGWIVLASLANAAQPIAWTRLHLPGKTLVLLDGQRVERYHLAKDGLVSAVVGEVNGPSAAPLWYWRIEEDNLVITESPGAPAREALRLRKANGRVLLVSRQSGGLARFRLDRSSP